MVNVGARHKTCSFSLYEVVISLMLMAVCFVSFSKLLVSISLNSFGSSKKVEEIIAALSDE